MKGICIKCNVYPISNSWFKLCVYCNEERLKYKKKENPKPKKKTKVKKDNLPQVKADFKQEHRDKGTYKCSGCGADGEAVFLSASHIIPISLRRDLREEKENLVLDCMDCHPIWEHNQKEAKKKIKNYEERMCYIKKVDSNYYNRLKDKE